MLPALAVSSSSNSSSNQKPFTITVTSIPSTSKAGSSSQSSSSQLPSKTDSFAAFLQQAEQQNLLLKQQQKLLQNLPSTSAQRKSYEAILASINKAADYSPKLPGSYSHEAKVNKWLAEQNAVIPEQPLGADYLSRRRRPRMDPTILDWKKLTGEENVSVIHRTTGKKITGSKAPQLKRLSQWLIENPMYDVDPKWSELVKESKPSLDPKLQRPLSSGSLSSNPDRKKSRSMLESPSVSPSVSSANLATSLASSMQFPSLGASSLSGLNSSLLSGMSGMGAFDPKNPLLMPFGGMPNMNALAGMSGLGNLSNMNLFANLASLGLPGLPGMDGSAMSADGNLSSPGGTSGSNKAKRKSSDSHTSGKTPTSSSSSSSIPTTSPFPFFFPNPSLLYTPLGLGSALNPFSLQPGISAYDTLAQQCSLLNGGLGVSSSSTTTTSPSTSSRPSSKTSSRVSMTQSSPSSRHNRDKLQQQAAAQLHQQQLQQLLLPHDTHLLETLSRATSLEAAQAALRNATEKHQRSESRNQSDQLKLEKEKRKIFEQITRSTLPAAASDFVAAHERMNKTSKRDDKKPLDSSVDISKALLAEMAASAMAASTGSSKRSREQEMKEALEHLSKTSAELIARSLAADEQQRPPSAHKRPRDTPTKEQEITNVPDELPIKRLRETTIEKVAPASDSQSAANAAPQNTNEMDIEDLIAPSTVVKGGSLVVETTNVEDKISNAASPAASISQITSPVPAANQSGELSEQSQSEDKDTHSADAQSGNSESDSPESAAKKANKKRNKRPRSGELEPEVIAPERKRELRSSAGRAAAAAAARAAAEAAAAKQQITQIPAETEEI